MRIIQPTGEIVDFEPQKILPLDVDTLLAAVRGEKLFKFEMAFSEAVITAPGGHPVKHGAGAIKPAIKFHHPPKLFAVVEGGWLPLPLVAPYNLLADRNVISRLKEIAGGKPPDAELGWWLDMLRTGDFHINPLPAAIEGFTRTFPSFDEFKVNFQEAVQNLHDFLNGTLAGTKIIEFTDELYPQVYQILSDFNNRYQPAIEFLKQTSPMIVRTAALPDRQKIEDRIFEIAESVGMDKISFAMIAVLSCLYQKDGVMEVARKIIKPSLLPYSDDRAFNALSDMRILSMYAAGLGAEGMLGGGKNARFALATGDRALALFASGLEIREVTLGEHGADMKLSLTPLLFPGLDDTGRKRLSSRITT